MNQDLFSVNRRSFLKTGALLGGLYGLNGLLPIEATGADEINALRAEAIVAPTFDQAIPVWAQGREKEMNVTLVFTANITIDSKQKTDAFLLRMTGSTIARILVNGQFAGYGPARGPHHWFRIDEWKIGKFLKPGNNSIAIEVAGYNSNSYYLLDQPSFLQAEVVDNNGKIVAATGLDGKTTFQAEDLTGYRVQKVQRFSFQRPFIEVYNGYEKKKPVKLARQPEVQYLPRRVPYPEFALLNPEAWLKTGSLGTKKVERPWRNRELTNIGPKLKGYKIDELSVLLSDEIQALDTKFNETASAKTPGSRFQKGDFQIVDFGAEFAGFFRLELEDPDEETVVAITFDEILDDRGDINFLRLGTCSAIKWTLAKEEKSSVLEAFEPHVARYAKIHCLKGSFKLKQFQMREYAYPPTRNSEFACSDARLEKLYRAGVLTFRENSVDVFTDCPHRERAGWLCDSFFTARTAFDLTGKTDIEQAFFENYQLPKKFECLPDGMLPMCYPADHYDQVYIPNWALWFVVELAEYSMRSPDRSTVNGLKMKIEKLIKFFEKYENSDGLLEKLPSWVFVEWSAANNFVQDVNYPSNMLYAAALDAAGKIYNKKVWRDKAVKIRNTIIQQSYDGTFFVDNAKRTKDGKLEVTRNRSEVCQYFAFFFKTATPQSHPALWKKMLNEFGPDRIKKGGYPEIHKANSFVGNVLRLELLSWDDRGSQLLLESVAYNEYMADRTGTLWENDSPHASCNHGFASHICRVLYRDVLGISEVDPLNKKIKIRFQKFDQLQWAEGKQPIPGGVIELRWEKSDGKISYSLKTPKDYDVTVEHVQGIEPVRKK